MKIQGAYFEMVSNQCTFQINPLTHVPKYMRRQNHGHKRGKDRPTDRQTDRVKPIYPQTSFAGGIIK